MIIIVSAAIFVFLVALGVDCGVRSLAEDRRQHVKVIQRRQNNPVARALLP